MSGPANVGALGGSLWNPSPYDTLRCNVEGSWARCHAPGRKVFEMWYDDFDYAPVVVAKRLGI